MIRVVVLICPSTYAKIVFREAYRMGLMKESYVWITTDAITGETTDLEYDGQLPEFYRGLIGTIPDYGEGRAHLEEFKREYRVYRNRTGDVGLSVPAVMIADGIGMVSRALESVDTTRWNTSRTVTCPDLESLGKAERVWEGGTQIIEQIKRDLYIGLSGDIAFTSEGVTVSNTYTIMNLQRGGFRPVGRWTQEKGLVIHAPLEFLGESRFTPTGLGRSLSGFHLKIGIVPEPPIAYLDTSIPRCNRDPSQNDCWYGWNVDIIERLSIDLNFTFQYVVPRDRKYGGYNEATKHWSGMVGDLVGGRTDMSAALAVNFQRSAYIDYTVSFFEDQAAFIFYEDDHHHKSISNRLIYLVIIIAYL